MDLQRDQKKHKKKKKLQRSSADLRQEDDISDTEVNRKNSKATGKMKRKREKGSCLDIGKVAVSNTEGKLKKTNRKKNKDLDSSKKHKKSLKKGEDDCDEPGDQGCSKEAMGNSKKAGMKRKKGQNSFKEAEKSQEKRGEADLDDVYQISSVDEDCSKGMRKWITEYRQSRPGLKVLQQKMDDFITTYEAQLEQERKEREAKAAEGGWTVVVHHKGRKKTTDAESGITVGSVAQAVVADKMATKKSKEVGSDFYRFQRREAQRNEIMMLQSKFEQDKKRIQQLRAARKFRPY